MSTEAANLEDRLKSLIEQLKTESGILDRIIYKGKNQHRHCLYFQYLQKVRRDVKLLISSGLEEILSYHFQIINGSKPKQMVHLLERLKQKKHHRGKHNFHDRLLGVARLLSEMVEPIIKAAIQISTLLARSFFMSFSLTVLALLSRFRVLVQQILLDIVLVFNMVSSVAQKMQSTKFKQDEIEVFHEYFPPSEVVLLECIWEGDKFVLLEKASKSEMKRGIDLENEKDISFEGPSIQYECIELSHEDSAANELEHAPVPQYFTNQELVSSPCESKRDSAISSSSQPVKMRDPTAEPFGAGVCSRAGGSPPDCSPVNCRNSVSPSPKSQSTSKNRKRGSRSRFSSSETKVQSAVKKVAFVAVAKPSPSKASRGTPQALAVEKPPSLEASCGNPRKRLKFAWPSGGDDDSDPFFSLLTAGRVSDTLF